MKIANTPRALRTLAAAAVVVGLPLAASAQTPLLSYDFNETGNTAFATGSAAAPPASNLTITGAGASRGADGSGVSGLPGDRAFDNTGPNSIIGGGRATASGDYDPIDALNSFTLAGWFRLPSTSQSIGGQAALVENLNSQIGGSAPRGGYGLTGSLRAGSGGLRLRVNEGVGVEGGIGSYAETGEYVFFAVTYDGSQAQFYKGLTDESAALVDTVGYAQGAVADEGQPLIVGVSQGGSSLTQVPFRGLIDNVGIYGQVLSGGQIESLRQSAFPAVPEPASLAVVGLGGLALLRRRRA